jgi:hypothetical protein
MADLFGRNNARHARSLVRRLVAVRDSAGKGTYHDADLKSLSDCLKSLAIIDKEARELVARNADVSVQTVRAIEAERTQPRYYNFMRVLDAARKVASDVADVDAVGGSHPESILRKAARGGWSADWVVKSETDELTLLRETLGGLIEALRTSDSIGEGDSAINRITREELITILETALNMLKGPMVERSFLSRTGTWLRSLGGKVLEREALNMIGHRLSEVASAIEAYLRTFL